MGRTSVSERAGSEQLQRRGSVAARSLTLGLGRTHWHTIISIISYMISIGSVENYSDFIYDFIIRVYVKAYDIIFDIIQ